MLVVVASAMDVPTLQQYVTDAVMLLVVASAMDVPRPLRMTGLTPETGAKMHAPLTRTLQQWEMHTLMLPVVVSEADVAHRRQHQHFHQLRHHFARVALP